MPIRRVHVLTTVRLVVLVSMILVQRNGAQGAEGQSGAIPPPAPEAARLSLTAEARLGVLPAQPQDWHIYESPSRAAAEAIQSDRGTAAEVFGRHWRYTIADDQWQPAGGERIAYLATSPDVEGRTGGYYVQNKLEEPAELARDEAVAERLDQVSRELVGLGATEPGGTNR